MNKPSRAFTRFAWLIVAYLVLVILWGAWVRITGSGAGCGNHWPTCNGEVLPIAPGAKTLVEFTHRLTSGLSLPLVLVMLVWGFKRFPRGHGVRWASIGTLVFLLSEAALGAGLVKFELVADNTSVARAVTASLHLINTFALSAFAALVAWWSKRDYHIKWDFKSRVSRWLIPGGIGLMLTAMSGAVTALGDTLFPTTLGAHTASDHFLVQLRIVHPILAVATGLYLLLALQILGERLKGGGLLTGLILTQLLLGAMNVLLSAPGWMQLVHLAMALAVWLTTLLVWVCSQEVPAFVDKTPESEVNPELNLA